MEDEVKVVECESGEITDNDYNPISEPVISDELKAEIMTSDEFIKGLQKSSYFAGLFTGLINCGFDVSTAHEVVVNECVAMNNIEMGRLQVEVAKYNYQAKEAQDI
jgi:hypothetical protein